MADGYHPSWTPATDEEILAMCHRLLMEAPTKELCVDLVMLLQRCRIAIEVAGARSATVPLESRTDPGKTRDESGSAQGEIDG